VRLALLLVLAVWPAAGRPSDTLHILFVGNSHTYVNNVPMLVESLAVAGGRLAVTDMSAPGGYSLMEHAVLQQTLDKIAQGGWDYVVLQEQSQIPVIPYWRDSGMYPASRLLDSLIRDKAAQTAFYMTWGWKNGGTHSWRGHSSPTFSTYFEMQDSVTAAYRGIQTELVATMCPVGLAWRLARTQDSLVDLWQADESHATLKGSYLGACVFYATLFQSSPVGLGYFAGLAPFEAHWLQEIAWQTVSGIAEEHPSLVLFSPVISISPNPCRTTATLRFSSELQPANCRLVTLRDASGRLILQRPVRTSTFDLRTSDLPCGLYFVSVGPVWARLIVAR
jgi:hypothetical protein